MKKQAPGKSGSPGAPVELETGQDESVPDWHMQALTQFTGALDTLAYNWDGVCVYSDRACWEFRQFHAVTENKTSFKLWVSDPVQSPVTKCPHLYLNCRRVWL